MFQPNNGKDTPETASTRLNPNFDPRNTPTGPHPGSSECMDVSQRAIDEMEARHGIPRLEDAPLPEDDLDQLREIKRLIGAFNSEHGADIDIATVIAHAGSLAKGKVRFHTFRSDAYSDAKQLTHLVVEFVYGDLTFYIFIDQHGDYELVPSLEYRTGVMKQLKDLEAFRHAFASFVVLRLSLRMSYVREMATRARTALNQAEITHKEKLDMLQSVEEQYRYANQFYREIEAFCK